MSNDNKLEYPFFGMDLSQKDNGVRQYIYIPKFGVMHIISVLKRDSISDTFYKYFTEILGENDNREIFKFLDLHRRSIYTKITRDNWRSVVKGFKGVDIPV